MTWPFDVLVSRELCSGTGALFGGWGLGLLADAAQRATGRRLRDLSAAFVRPVRQGDRLSVRCDVLAEGRALAQCRVEAECGGGTALTGTAVLEESPGEGLEQGTAERVEHAGPPPAVPGPQECPERSYESGSGRDMLLDVRVARRTPGSALLWARVLREAPDEVRLAVVSDHIPYLIRRTLPGRPRATTVSASLRLLGGPVAEWVLLDVSLVAHAGRTAAGRVTLWQDGATLAGVGEQTVRLGRTP
jgi:hypothetical protein